MDDGEHSAVVNFLERDHNSGSAVESLRIGAGHGESGIIAAIEDTAGKVLFQQTEDHTSRVQCFALLRADREPRQRAFWSSTGTAGAPCEVPY